MCHTTNIDENWLLVAKVPENICYVYIQEHFYLETQASLVVPKDHGEIEMFVSTQNAHKTQVS